MIYGPFKQVGHCTFCGTPDVLCHPVPRAHVGVSFFSSLPPEKVHTAETHQTACPDCCEMQDDGHDFTYFRSEGWTCDRCGCEPPSDFFDGID